MARKPKPPCFAESGLAHVAAYLDLYKRLAAAIAKRINKHPDDVLSLFFERADVVASRFDAERGVPFDKYMQHALGLAARADAAKERRQRMLLKKIECPEHYLHPDFEHLSDQDIVRRLKDELSSTEWWLLCLRAEGSTLEELADLMRVSRNTLRSRLDVILTTARSILSKE